MIGIKKVKYRRDGTIKKIEFYDEGCGTEGEGESPPRPSSFEVKGESVQPAVNGNTLVDSNDAIHKGVNNGDGRLAQFSEREKAVLARLSDANKVIARELGVAEATVKVHVKAVLRKLRMQNRTQAATWFHGRGV